MPWKKGQSGNKKGRPPKARALTEMIAKAGAKKREGSKLTAYSEFAQRLWEGLTQGRIVFPDGRVMVLEPSDFVSMSKMLLTQIDGPPKAEMDMTSGGEPIVAINISAVPNRATPPKLDDTDFEAEV